MNRRARIKSPKLPPVAVAHVALKGMPDEYNCEVTALLGSPNCIERESFDRVIRLLGLNAKFYAVPYGVNTAWSQLLHVNVRATTRGAHSFWVVGYDIDLFSAKYNLQHRDAPLIDLPLDFCSWAFGHLPL